MSRARPLALSAIPQVNPEAEGGVLAADKAPALAAVNRGQDLRFLRFQLREPARERLARTRRLQAAGRCDIDAHAIASRQLKKVCRSQNSTSSI
jgi:hypothetical protein